MQYTFRPIQQWPRPLSTQRSSSPFRASYRETLKLLNTELDALNARNIFLQIALRPEDIRLDGQPRANAKPAAHPGVILTFEKWVPSGKVNERGQKLGNYREFSMPCDTYTDWQSNLRAIALSLEALRKVDRYGITQHGEQYTGWAQLPGGNAEGGNAKTLTPERTAARVLMGLMPIGQVASGGVVTEDDLLKSAEQFQRVFRLSMRKHHPDHGGKTADFQRLQQAGGVLKKHFGLK